jgi:hypothetical protein
LIGDAATGFTWRLAGVVAPALAAYLSPGIAGSLASGPQALAHVGRPAFYGTPYFGGSEPVTWIASPLMAFATAVVTAAAIELMAAGVVAGMADTTRAPRTLFGAKLGPRDPDELGAYDHLMRVVLDPSGPAQHLGSLLLRGTLLAVGYLSIHWTVVKVMGAYDYGGMLQEAGAWLPLVGLAGVGTDLRVAGKGFGYAPFFGHGLAQIFNFMLGGSPVGGGIYAGLHVVAYLASASSGGGFATLPDKIVWPTLSFKTFWDGTFLTDAWAWLAAQAPAFGWGLIVRAVPGLLGGIAIALLANRGFSRLGLPMPWVAKALGLVAGAAIFFLVDFQAVAAGAAAGLAGVGVLRAVAHKLWFQERKPRNTSPDARAGPAWFEKQLKVDTAGGYLADLYRHRGYGEGDFLLWAAATTALAVRKSAGAGATSGASTAGAYRVVHELLDRCEGYIGAELTAQQKATRAVQVGALLDLLLVRASVLPFDDINSEPRTQDGGQKSISERVPELAAAVAGAVTKHRVDAHKQAKTFATFLHKSAYSYPTTGAGFDESPFGAAFRRGLEWLYESAVAARLYDAGMSYAEQLDRQVQRPWVDVAKENKIDVLKEGKVGQSQELVFALTESIRNATERGKAQIKDLGRAGTDDDKVFGLFTGGGAKFGARQPVQPPKPTVATPAKSANARTIQKHAAEWAAYEKENKKYKSDLKFRTEKVAAHLLALRTSQDEFIRRVWVASVPERWGGADKSYNLEAAAELLESDKFPDTPLSPLLVNYEHASSDPNLWPSCVALATLRWTAMMVAAVGSVTRSREAATRDIAARSAASPVAT